MKTKTVGLLAMLAALLVSGCNGGNDSSSKTSDNHSNTNSNKPVDPDFGEGYVSIFDKPEVEARGIPSNLQDLSGVKEYRSAFTSDPNTFDYLSNNKQTNSQYYANFVDNLLEHDQYGFIRGALAVNAAYNEDCTSLRFKLRPGVKWVTHTGNEVGEVKADDFAAGLQHLLDAKGGAETLAYYIQGAKAYAEGTDTNFKKVGFVVHNDYEIEYFLEEPCPFFHTFFEYTSFLPLNRKFFKQVGGEFGVNEWKEAKSSCDFGLTSRPDYLLYCGPYILNEFTSQTKLTMVKNEKYWDAGNVQIERAEYVYNSGTNATALIEMFKKNQLSSLGVNATTRDEIVAAFGEDAVFEQGTGTTTYYYNWNLNRQTYKVGNSISAKANDTAAQENTRKAILNENFRKAIFSAIPKIEMNARADDNATAEVCIRNTYTTPDFVKISKDVPASDTNLAQTANSEYYEMVNKEMKALNKENGDEYAKYKAVYNKETGKESYSDEELSTFADREDSYYNIDTAASLAQKAKKELEAQGVTLPVQIDYLVYDTSDVMVNQAEILKDRIEKNIGFLAKINIQTAGLSDYENSHFMAPSGADMNFDLSSGTGWGPDYGDPATFLSTLTWQGDLYNNLGLDNKPSDKEIYDAVLGDYQKLYDDATEVRYDAEGNFDFDTRYAKLAAAEAELLSSAVIMPNTTDGGGYAISRIVPRTNQRSFYGTDDSRFKYMVLVSDVITKTERDEIIADWTEKYNQLNSSSK